MRNLTEHLKESFAQKEAEGYNAKDDPSKIDTIIRIQETGLDCILGDQLKADSEDDAYNEKMKNFQNAYKELVTYLEKDGLININGFRIQKLINI